MVYVLSKTKEQLMPCNNVVARLLLKQKKAKVRTTVPFIIQLNYETTGYKQDLKLKVDSGSGKSGYAVADKRNSVVYMSVVENRNDVSEKMIGRSKSRFSQAYSGSDFYNYSGFG